MKRTIYFQAIRDNDYKAERSMDLTFADDGRQ